MAMILSFIFGEGGSLDGIFDQTPGDRAGQWPAAVLPDLPRPLAQALEMKGETIEWVVEDKWTLRIRRGEARSAQASRRSHGKR